MLNRTHRTGLKERRTTSSCTNPCWIFVQAIDWPNQKAIQIPWSSRIKEIFIIWSILRLFISISEKMEDTDPNKPQSPQDFLQEQLTNASTLFESSLSAASDALKKSTASAKSEADRAAGLLQVSVVPVKGVTCTPIVRDNSTWPLSLCRRHTITRYKDYINLMTLSCHRWKVCC